MDSRLRGNDNMGLDYFAFRHLVHKCLANINGGIRSRCERM